MLIMLLKRTLFTVVTLLFTTTLVQAHSGPLSEIAVKACDVKSRSQSCQYENDHQNLYIGSCQYMSETLMCVRNQPIQKIETNDNESTTKEHKHD
ncbi:hypothetical protein V6255_14655 [Psychromonas arctica]|uniref:Uncharacterized protein n=1 Tax=Psychromonas arctica TaxID=168275 RepID=A0ABU9HEQ1_9GAMM